jgi:hypothetical protein
MPKDIQLEVASVLEASENAKHWSRRDNGKTIVFTHHKGRSRYVIKPLVTHKQKKIEFSSGGTEWFTVTRFENKRFLTAVAAK